MSDDIKKYIKLLEMAQMNRQELPMGMSQYIGDEYALVGGMRSGSSPAGVTRLRFDIYHIETIQIDEEKAKAGKVELFIDNETNNIEGLVNIEINSNYKGGLGRKIVNDIIDTAGGELMIHDIQSKARGFWEKMGIEYTEGKRRGIIKN